MIIERVSAVFREHSAAVTREAPSPVVPFMVIVAAVIVIVSVFALMAAIWLSISYAKDHHRKNTAGMTGRDVARRVLDDHDLTKIKVAASSSVLLGNSYSHLFRKLRLRRRLWGSDSVAALAAAVRTACLAILSAQGDADMKSRRRATPLICLGAWALVPLILAGVVLDLAVPFAKGWWMMGFTVLALVLYLVSLVLALRALRTEKKAQTMALDLLAGGLASDEELDRCKKLYRLHTAEYVNDLVLAPLSPLYRLFQRLPYARDAADDPAPTDE